MNSLFVQLGLQHWKPLLTSLLLPPVPLLLLLLAAGGLLWRRRTAGWALLWIGVIGLWLSTSTAVAEALREVLLSPPPALSGPQVDAVRREARERPTAIVVLGGGREDFAPEYAGSSLTDNSLERLRYGLWLARRTGLPVAFSGGVGWGDGGADRPEAEVAAAIAAEEFGRPLRWVESASRDTRENAQAMLRQLPGDGIRRVLLVSHGWHLPRAVRAFEQAAAHAGVALAVVPAPIALAPRIRHPVLRWLPSGEGLELSRAVWREALGRLAGA
ncbi:YdcF family protein [Aquabacterium sp. J223]|uniref:YdcF family protein n=1 Tax=Aquabacterium sp. J223 TaxID=2898431 RepID=UPI0021ADC137|nr:YdcF family protein [Aquabacterium sp. J223]UUX94594.1 YdcF family protein [Aquabacterium sp. J223]